jgi:hypothetical protein
MRRSHRRVLIGVAAVALLASGCLREGTYQVTPVLQNGTASPGLWHSLGGDGCYWERLSGFSGDVNDIIANDFSSGGPRWVEIKSGDAGFSTSGCYPFVLEPGPYARPFATPGSPFDQGQFKIGYEVAPGTYSAPGAAPGSGCYWERESGFGGTFDEIIANDFTFGSGSQVVTIDASDVGFSSSGCGTWTKIG